VTRFAVVMGLSAGFAVFVACNSDTGISSGFPDADAPEEEEVLVDEPVDGDAPIAMCTVNRNPVQPPFETALFDGGASFDPAGREIIGYEWSITNAPPGNAAALSSNIEQTTSLTPQLAGVYRVELTVQNDLGLRSEEPCVIELSATPDEDLWVEMFWSNTGEDMDLHLLRPGGSLETDGDCYYGNCAGGGFFGGIDWGTQGVTDDDPVLDLDDIPGVGPENINLTDPEAGDFTVVVHDYPGSSRPEATNVTVNVYLGGEQVFTEQRSISGEDTYTNYVRVNPTTGAVTPL
jgi:hypothetical protein